MTSLLSYEFETYNLNCIKYQNSRNFINVDSCKNNLHAMYSYDIKGGNK